MRNTMDKIWFLLDPNMDGDITKEEFLQADGLWETLIAILSTHSTHSPDQNPMHADVQETRSTPDAAVQHANAAQDAQVTPVLHSEEMLRRRQVQAEQLLLTRELGFPLAARHA